ncbi:alpha 1,2 mannosyltransferase [Coemansia sp. RSA 1933]|nr:alpha 1,2 mannosyltransferase [Coemansia sp. RSA 1933]
MLRWSGTLRTLRALRTQRALYAALLVARVLLALSPGYIHPDEFFQAGEVAGGDILGVDSVRTWEFSEDAPIRSIVPIYLYAGLPLALVRLLMGGHVSAYKAFAAQRLFMVLVSVAVDWLIGSAIRRRHPNARLLPTALLVASSHAMAVFHARTFGNAFASATLALCFDQLALLDHVLGTKDPSSERGLAVFRALAALAAAGVVGIFTHITFVPFFAPLALAAAALVVSAIWNRILPVGQAVRAVGAACISAMVAALLIMVADSAYYGSLNGRVPGHLTCTVLNNLRYNSRAANLATHGLHPWYLHVVASLPILFGPLYLLGLRRLWTAIRRHHPHNDHGCLSLTALWSATMGVAVLSLVPHQEPRFLLPALPAIVLATWRWHRLLPAVFWHSWAIYNMVLALIYGTVHQAGVVPAMRFLADTAVAHRLACHPVIGGNMVCAHNQPDNGSVYPALRTRVLLHATYMAPRHLLVQHRDGVQARVEITDLVSMDDDAILTLLRAAVPVDCNAVPGADLNGLVFAPSTDTRGLYERTLLVVPASATLPLSFGRLRLLHSFGPHVNFDHIQTVVRNPRKYARLNVYLVCAQLL